MNRGLTVEAVRATRAAIYRGELAIRAGLADRLGTLDAAIAEMAAELDRAAPTRAIINPTFKRSLSMATNETDQIQDQPSEPQQAADAPLAITQAAPDPAPTLAPASIAPEASAAERLRAEFAEIAAIATQATRLGVAVDAADAIAKGVSPDALRRTVLDTLAARAEATSVIAAAPPAAAANDSPIVRRAKERAAAARP